MDDDFGTPQALATLFDLAREINRADETGHESEEARKGLMEMAGVLGLVLKPTRKLVRPVGIPEAEEFGTPSVGETASEEDIENLIRQRNILRQAKQWQLADEIRAKLEKLGIALEDTPQGTVWRRKR
jgi:cysteinyl-tRNA synthetase